MYQKRISFILILIFIVLVSSSCQKKTSGGSATYDKEPRQVKTYEDNYQEALKTLQNKKAEIEKHIKNYKLSQTERRSVLDDRETNISNSEITQLARELIIIVDNCLRNEEVIKNVSSSKRTYQEYKQYANDILRKY